MIARGGAVAVALGAALWGLFWIPLRYIEQSGIHGLAVIAVANAVAAGVLLVVANVHSDNDLKQLFGKPVERPVIVLGSMLGLSSVLYMLALLHTDVVRAVFLFYLLPVWAALASRVLHETSLSRSQWAAIAFTVIGVWLLLGGSLEQLIVRPSLGDMLAIVSGMTWGLGLAILGGSAPMKPVASALASFVAATVWASLSLLLVTFLSQDRSVDIIVSETESALPALSLLAGSVFPWVLTMAFGALLLMPSVLAQVWGADRLPATVAAILTTTEILVATASAVWLIGTRVDQAGAIGAVLVFMAIGLSLRTSHPAT